MLNEYNENRQDFDFAAISKLAGIYAEPRHRVRPIFTLVEELTACVSFREIRRVQSILFFDSHARPITQDLYNIISAEIGAFDPETHAHVRKLKRPCKRDGREDDAVEIARRLVATASRHFGLPPEAWHRRAIIRRPARRERFTHPVGAFGGEYMAHAADARTAAALSAALETTGNRRPEPTTSRQAFVEQMAKKHPAPPGWTQGAHRRRCGLAFVFAQLAMCDTAGQMRQVLNYLASLHPPARDVVDNYILYERGAPLRRLPPKLVPRGERAGDKPAKLAALLAMRFGNADMMAEALSYVPYTAGYSARDMTATSYNKERRPDYFEIWRDDVPVAIAASAQAAAAIEQAADFAGRRTALARARRQLDATSAAYDECDLV